MPDDVPAKGKGDGGHETDDTHEGVNQDGEEATPGLLSPSPSPHPPAVFPPQTAGDMMMNLLRQVRH